MRLARLDLTRYGRFTGASLDFGERQPGRPDLHVVYGPNEAGKSTAFSAFLDLLFGIEKQSGYAFLHPYKTMRIGAALELGGAAPKVFGRVKLLQNSLLDAADQPVGDSMLLGCLSGLDRTSYRNMFSLDDETLEKGGESIIASQGDLGQLLFSASAGLSDLSQTLEGLRAEADTFHRGRAKSELSALKQQLERLRSDREGLDTALPVYRKLVETSEASRLRYEHELGQRAILQARANAVDRLLQALPRFATLQALRERLQPLRDLPQPPSGWRSELPELQRDDIALATQRAGCEAEIAKLAAERDGIVVDEAALRLATRIDDLADDARARFVTAEKDLPERRRSLADHDTAIATLLRRLEREDEPDPDRLVLSASVTGAFRALIERRSGVEATLETARTQQAEAKQALAGAEAALSSAGGADDTRGTSLAPLKAQLAAAAASDHATRRRLAETNRGTLGDDLCSRMALLRPWSGTIEELAAGVPPRAADLSRWQRDEAELTQRAVRHDGDIERLTTDRLRLEADLEAATRHEGIVTGAEAATIRTRREQAWARHRRDLQPDSADSFEEALRQDDLVTAARLNREGDIARLRQVAQTLAAIEADLARATELRDSVRLARERLGAEIGQAMRDLGWPDTPQWPAAELERWLRHRGECLDLHGKLRDEARVIESADAAARDVRDRVAAALGAAGAAPRVDAGLAEVLASAEALVERETNLSGLRSQLQERRNAVLRREREFQTAAAADAEWREGWAQACATCWLGERGAVPPLSTVREIIVAVTDLGPWLEKRAALALRIEKMEDDQASFTGEMARLASELGLEAGDGSPLDRAAALTDRLTRARAGEQARRGLAERLAELHRQRDRLAESKLVHARRCEAMFAFFGVASLAEVAACLDDAKQKAELAEAARDREHELVTTLGAASLADAEASLAGADRMALEAERDDLKPRLVDLDERTRTLFADHSRASDAVANVGGDDAVARIAETRRTVLLDIEDKATRYLRLRIGIAAAEQALRVYRERHRSSMMREASEAFRTISRGAYGGLAAQPGKDGDVLVALHANGSKEAEQLSKGTRFQLYLALRVAGYYEYCRSREPVPFVADDIMETFDDFRAEEAFRLFAGMAEVGQVIYLTHHRHLCDIARSVCPGVRISELSVG